VIPHDFIVSVAPLAKAVGPEVGFFPSVVLAQWADETAWGNSPHWTAGHNPAGISPGGVVASYPSIGAGLAAYVETANLSFYDPVREAKLQGSLAQALALGRAPWAAGQYKLPGQAPGSALVAIIENYGLQLADGANPQPQSDLEVLFDMLTDPAFAVRYLYRFALKREVDPAGFANDVAFLDAGGSLNDLLATLQDSAEGQAVIAAERALLKI
jgi:hypothetical protein